MSAAEQHDLKEWFSKPGLSWVRRLLAIGALLGKKQLLGFAADDGIRSRTIPLRQGGPYGPVESKGVLRVGGRRLENLSFVPKHSPASPSGLYAVNL